LAVGCWLLAVGCWLLAVCIGCDLPKNGRCSASYWILYHLQAKPSSPSFRKNLPQGTEEEGRVSQRHQGTEGREGERVGERGWSFFFLNLKTFPEAPERSLARSPFSWSRRSSRLRAFVRGFSLLLPSPLPNMLHCPHANC